ncbi:MAG: class I SAM-dependent methyltransferase [Desulfobacterales bacterium]|jgi:SAM-dependent methyltransferase
MSVNYDELAESYRRYRTPDARIASSIWAHLEGAERVLNVGAGTGAYEPDNCEVVAVEPSEQMTMLRRTSRAKLVRASAENLPFDDGAFDASMALLSIHHWSDIRRGLKEMLRVTIGNIVVFTWVGYGNDFWLEDYISAMRGIDLALFLDLRELEEILGSITVEPVEIPYDCSDGFMCAYWRRPRVYLNPAAWKAISTFSRIGAIEESLRNLEDDLASGEWDRKYGHLLAKPSMDLGYRLVVCDRAMARPGAAAAADPSGRLR